MTTLLDPKRRAKTLPPEDIGMDVQLESRLDLYYKLQPFYRLIICHVSKLDRIKGHKHPNIKHLINSSYPPH